MCPSVITIILEYLNYENSYIIKLPLWAAKIVQYTSDKVQFYIVFNTKLYLSGAS